MDNINKVEAVQCSGRISSEQIASVKGSHQLTFSVYQKLLSSFNDTASSKESSKESERISREGKLYMLKDADGGKES